MSSSNGDATVRYRITQDDKKWVVKIGDAPDLSGSKLQRWIRENDIHGDLQVTVEQRVGDVWYSAGPFPIDADTLQ